MDGNRDDTGTPGSMPGAQESTILLLDAVLTLLRLGKAEALRALAVLPQLLCLNLYRLPLLLLTWISFGVLVACLVYTLTGRLVFSAGSFFVLQLGLTLMLERRYRRLRVRIEFAETRKGVEALRASLVERFGHDAERV